MALKDVPSQFDIDSEDDLRFAISQYFIEIGFEPQEFSFEDQFLIRLGHTTFTRQGKAVSEGRGRSDLLLTRNGAALAIVEVKRSDHPLTDEDAEQAISYARLLRQIAPFAIVTNGSETRVYDSFASDLSVVQIPTDSAWYKNGQSELSISEDIKFQASRLLLEINPETLSAFCIQQVEQSLTELKGSVSDRKFYIPEVYVERMPIMESFNEWLSSDASCFALVGESGQGKTNFMCGTAEALLKDYYVVFYSVLRLRDGLLSAIRDDFLWEFHREREIAYIVERFEDIARKRNRQIIIFVDGADEFPGSRDIFKNELLDFVSRMKGLPIKLCLSCKAFDWGEFVIERGQYFNQFAESIFSPLRPTKREPEETQPNERHIGVWISNFTDDELSEVFEKYRKAFSLQGQLRGSTRIECGSPLMLRLVAEVYQGQGSDLPSEVSSQAIFELYWTRKLGSIPRHLKHLAEQFLCEVANSCIEANNREVEFTSVRKNFDWNVSLDEAAQATIRLGLLRNSIDKNHFEWLSFGFEKLRSYVFSVKAKQFPIKDVNETARLICDLMRQAIGAEAVEFYLTVFDRGESRLMNELARFDFDTFVHLLYSFNMTSDLDEHFKIKDRADAYLKRLAQYAETYSEITEAYFENLEDFIPPYAKGRKGVWISEDFRLWQLRSRTEKYPQPVIVVTSDVAGGLFSGRALPEVYSDLRPAGTMFFGHNDILGQLPQKVAWTHIVNAIADLLKDRLLDELSSPTILEERAWELLSRRPGLYFQGEIHLKENYWQVLGLNSFEQIYVTPVAELMSRTNGAIREYQAQFPQNIPIRELDTIQRSHYRKMLEARELYYWLEFLQPNRPYLSETSHYQDYWTQPNYSNDPSLEITFVRELVPKIVAAYQSMVLKNFPQIAKRFALFRHIEAPMLLELSGGFGNFLEITYVVMPSVVLPDKYHVELCRTPDCLSKQKLVRLDRSGNTGRTRLGVSSVALEIAGITVNEPEAFIYKTRFSRQYPICEQVYQLLAAELEWLLTRGNDPGQWSRARDGARDTDQLNQRINAHYEQIYKAGRDGAQF